LIPQTTFNLTTCKAPEFAQIQQRAKELGTQLHYRRIDVRDTELLNSVIESIANDEGRMDGLVAAAGIQQETPALEYSAKDSNTMFEVNVTGVFMTSQAVAKQMIRFGNGGSIAMIASMSGTIANRVRFQSSLSSYPIPFSVAIHPFLFIVCLGVLPTAFKPSAPTLFSPGFPALCHVPTSDLMLASI
jgi:NAD(P)-dependent dehydrogenase (short-subunit alcohol dehydrogenase family)